MDCIYLVGDYDMNVEQVIEELSKYPLNMDVKIMTDCVVDEDDYTYILEITDVKIVEDYNNNFNECVVIVDR